MDAYETGMLDRAEFEQRTQRLRVRLDELKIQAEELTRVQSQSARSEGLLASLTQFAEMVRERLATADWALKRDIITALVKRVEIDEDEVRIVYRIPPQPFKDNPGAANPSLQQCPDRAGTAVVPQNGSEGHDLMATIDPASEIELDSAFEASAEFGIGYLNSVFKDRVLLHIKRRGRGFLDTHDLMVAYQETIIGMLVCARRRGFEPGRSLRMVLSIVVSPAGADADRVDWLRHVRVGLGRWAVKTV